MNHPDQVNRNRENPDADFALPSGGWAETLASLRDQGLERRLRRVSQPGGILHEEGRRILNLSSNDYLGFARRAELIAAAKQALDAFGSGSGASRLVTGNLPLHEELEATLARHKGYPAALVFGSGYMTNAGVISSICTRDWTVLADRLIHASLIDAVALAGARLKRFQHNDPEDLSRLLAKESHPERVMVVVESVYSMDGDLAPLADLARVCSDRGVMLMVDEAHATGVFGPEGSGLVAEAGLQTRVALAMSTFSKALGSYGGAVACPELLRTWMIHKARAFIYTTALPPPVIASTLAALRVLEQEPGLGARLLATARAFRDRLNQAGVDTLDSDSQIIPVLIGDNHRALAVDRRLAAEGILATALRPPTVPPGKARLRLSITLDHTPEDLDRVYHALLGALTAEGLR
ncbi:MAG TPA: 8-amino-7-oxononanoate synthase [Kiritimatiellia bacterium]|nr:8-amino-7-oxononanoate synthase [Kiritimatiellia bacterium]